MKQSAVKSVPFRKPTGYISAARAPNAVTTLCPACGLCCNGVLFADLRLQPGDNVARLKALGMSLGRGQKKIRVTQPCACFDGRLCGIYAERPLRCRTFECGLLQKVSWGELDSAVALERIGLARTKVRRVERLLCQLGQTDSHLPLGRRYALIIAQPLDLAAGDHVLDLRSKLMSAMDDLMQQVQSQFLSSGAQP